MNIAETNKLNEFLELANPEIAISTLRFFKQTPDSYCKNDKFLGVKTPLMRTFIKKCNVIFSLDSIESFLQSEFNDIRVFGWCILEKQYHDSSVFINFAKKYASVCGNWNVVDNAAPITAKKLNLNQTTKLGYELYELGNLWSVRFSIVLSLTLIRQGHYTYALDIVEKNLSRSEDMIRKPVGWMLREVGKKDKQLLQAVQKSC